MTHDLPGERPALLSTLPASPQHRRLALALVLLSALVFLAAAPVARTPLPVWPAFIPAYQSSLVVCDVITAVMLLGQFSVLRTRGTLVLACGYLFTAMMAVAHMLTFPGLFAPTGLLGAHSQSTAWLYMFWHGGFPVLVIVYVMLGRRGEEQPMPAGKVRGAVLWGIGTTTAMCAGFTALATAGHALLPPIMSGHRYTSHMLAVVSSVWALSLLALLAVARRRPYTVLDLWLVVVMCAWLFDIALAAVLNGGRFDLGFYLGRLYGLLAASFVLAVLLVEHVLLYARLVQAYRSEHQTAQDLRAANTELEAFSRTVSHDLRGPLRAMSRLLQMLQQNHSSQLGAEGRRWLDVVKQCADRMAEMVEALLEFSRLGRQALKIQRVRLDSLVRQIIEELRPEGEHRHIEFIVDELGDADVDPVLLKHALSNLLDNAIKYTSKTDEAVVEVRCRPDEAGGGKVYWIKDNGAGFDLQHTADRLFGVFQRFHTDAEFQGTGVGLAIVQQVISRHGGRLWADAQPGRGAAFYFTLPRHETVPMPATAG